MGNIIQGWYQNAGPSGDNKATESSLSKEFSSELSYRPPASLLELHECSWYKAAPPWTGHHIKADCRHHGGGLHRTRIARACECGYEKTDASDLGYLEPFLRALQPALLTTN